VKLSARTYEHADHPDELGVCTVISVRMDVIHEPEPGDADG
jgi:hypothetical protein